MNRHKFKLRKGFTTGTCAQAAAKAAGIMLITQKLLDKITVVTPLGIRLSLNLIGQKIGDNFAECCILKDSGSDPDVTNGARICAQVRLSDEQGISIKGAEGVGRVTKPGLAMPVGEWAINPVPRKLILKEITGLKNKYGSCARNKGFEVTISVPEGRLLAQKTFNPNLGIIGGISIIGTTGIVEPKSLDAYKAALSLQLNVLKASGNDTAVLVLGYVGERFCKERLNINADLIIKTGDHVGFMLNECAQKGIKQVFLVGHIGKLVKLTNGQFNTHYSFGDKRLESIARYAQDFKAKNQVIEEILQATTAEAAVDILRKNKLMKVFNKIAKDIGCKINGFVKNRFHINVVLLSLKGERLGAYPSVIFQASRLKN